MIPTTLLESIARFYTLPQLGCWHTIDSLCQLVSKLSLLSSYLLSSSQHLPPSSLILSQSYLSGESAVAITTTTIISMSSLPKASKFESEYRLIMRLIFMISSAVKVIHHLVKMNTTLEPEKDSTIIKTILVSRSTYLTLIIEWGPKWICWLTLYY